MRCIFLIGLFSLFFIAVQTRSRECFGRNCRGRYQQRCYGQMVMEDVCKTVVEHFNTCLKAFNYNDTISDEGNCFRNISWKLSQIKEMESEEAAQNITCCTAEESGLITEDHEADIEAFKQDIWEKYSNDEDVLNAKLEALEGCIEDNPVMNCKVQRIFQCLNNACMEKLKEMEEEKDDMDEMDDREDEMDTDDEMDPEDDRDPEEMNPEEMDPEEMDPEDDRDPEEMDPEEMDPEEMDPEEMDPEEMDPEEMDPEEMDPEEMDPEEMDPEDEEEPEAAIPEIPDQLAEILGGILPA